MLTSQTWSYTNQIHIENPMS
ncbi:hypothetical protein F383_37206 [Gossypium arboreum]|uniref:Uncharacterized protein n=1 Tax=Gossypium arboreum TaxID=29729 RepID=A0A0B0MBZ9_GOSAR|nr:hypothetical protein F383_37204 [Gossypium arboreum]KHF97856.1 hypothetical protein F383_37206 [Gossypium arboreum]